MKMVDSTLELRAVSGCQGVNLNDTEAAILLGYLGGNDYCLLMDDNRKIWLHDNQEGEKDDNDTPYTIRDVIEFCKELNGEILLNEESRDTTQPEYIMDLRKDEMLLDLMMERATKAIQPEPREYKIVVVEHHRKIVSVKAENWPDAELKVREAYEKGEISFDASDFAGVSFSLGR